MVDRVLGKKVAGVKQATKAIKSGAVKVLYVASDADFKLIKPLLEIAKEFQVEIQYIDTMKELGKLCSIDVGSAAMVTIKE